MLTDIQHHGKLIHEIRQPGEGRDELVAPHHPNGIQLSRDRFLLLISSMGYRSSDDSRGIAYQLRAHDFTGPLIREGMLTTTRNDWDPLGLGVKWIRQTGHPVAFGVPKGALLQGRRVPQENLFLARWRVCPRLFDPQSGAMLGHMEKFDAETHRRIQRATRVHAVQFRLNDAQDDITIVQEEAPLCERGFTDDVNGFCRHKLDHMNIGFVRAWPMDAMANQWIDMAHTNAVDGHSTAWAIGFEYDPGEHRYVWTRSGPRLGLDLDDGIFEASVLPWRGGWVFAARRRWRPGVAWAKCDDPFAPDAPAMVVPDDVKATGTPIAAYLCPDGVVRLFTGDQSLYPHHAPMTEWLKNRNPMYVWDIDPDHNFTASNRRMVLDTIAAGIAIPEGDGPVNDYAKLLPHLGGTRQHLLHRVRPSTLRSSDPRAVEKYGPRSVALTDEAFEATGVYHAELVYDQPRAPQWQFEPIRG